MDSALLLPAIHVALSLLGYSRLRAILENLAPLQPGNRPVTPADALPRAQQISRLVLLASQHGLYKASCLRRSVLIWWLLRREGMDSQICFGVRKSRRKLEAHAWVEYNRSVLNDSADISQRYQPLQDALPSTSVGL